jgi:hypothetical protein
LPNSWLKNILVLIVNPFSIGSAVVPLCKAFLGFKNAYFAGVDNPATIPTSHVALQIVPVKMIAGKEGLLMRGLEFQSFMRRLYDLCEVMESTTTTNPKPTVPSDLNRSLINSLEVATFSHPLPLTLLHRLRPLSNSPIYSRSNIETSSKIVRLSTLHTPSPVTIDGSQPSGPTIGAKSR